MREVDHRSSSRRNRHKSRSKSRDRDREYYSRRRRSTSRSRQSKSKKKKSKKKRYRRSSSSSSSSSTRSPVSIKSSSSVIRRNVQKRSSEEHLQSIHKFRDFNITSEIPERNVIEKIEEDSFTAKPFFSSAESRRIPEKVIIDLKNDTISVEEKEEDTHPEQSLLFHPNFLGDEMQKMERWVKKLYNYRQKFFQE